MAVDKRVELTLVQGGRILIALDRIDVVVERLTAAADTCWVGLGGGRILHVVGSFQETLDAIDAAMMGPP